MKAVKNTNQKKRLLFIKKAFFALFMRFLLHGTLLATMKNAKK